MDDRARHDGGAGLQQVDVSDAEPAAAGLLPDRRSLLGLAALVGAPAVLAAAPGEELADPGFLPGFAWELSMRLRWDGGRHDTGIYAGGRRIYNVVAGGEVRGARVRGRLLPGGGDWATMNPAAAALYEASAGRQVLFDARYALITDDGATIYVTNRGGKFTDAAGATSTYSVTTPLFDAPLGSRYAFLARNLYVGLALTRPGDTLMHVFRITAP